MNSRWIAKRLLKWAIEYGSCFSGLAALYRTTQYYEGSYRILTYHKITDSPKTSHDVETKHFVEHLRILSGEFNVLGLTELVNQSVIGKRPDPLSVAITFDDGYAELSGCVAETLEKFNLDATFFVVTGYVDGSINSDKGPYVTWDDLRTLDKAGFSIGSHSVSHVSMSDLASDRLDFELCHSFDRICDELGREPCGFSYPYGTMRDFSAATRDAVILAGYPWAVTAIHGVNPPAFDRYSLKRINMTCGDGAQTFRLIMKGCLDAWGIIDHIGYRFQRASYIARPITGVHSGHSGK